MSTVSVRVRPAYGRAMSLMDPVVMTIDGRERTLRDYQGKVLLVVNVASKCGLTPQYTGLEALHEKYGPRGLVVMGFPANEFGAQEPGTDAEIKSFCETKFDVSFPLYSKIVVKGEGQHPLYQALTEARPEAAKAPGTNFRERLIGYGINPGAAHEILWNFEKFLVDRSGHVVARFAPDMTPDDPQITAAIEKAL